MMKSVEGTPEQIASYDVVVMVTDHDAFDLQMVADNARFIVDTRNAFSDVALAEDRIKVLGGGQFLIHS